MYLKLIDLNTPQQTKISNRALATGSKFVEPNYISIKKALHHLNEISATRGNSSPFFPNATRITEDTKPLMRLVKKQIVNHSSLS